jgi:hypothetical protein
LFTMRLSRGKEWAVKKQGKDRGERGHIVRGRAGFLGVEVNEAVEDGD